MPVTVEPTLGREDQETMLDLYRSSIDMLGTEAAGVQAFSDEEFRAQLNNEAVLKLVGRDRAGRPQALCLVATELSAVPWVSPAFYAKRFPEQYDRKAIFYIGSVVVKPDSQAGGWAQALMKEITRLVGERGGIAAFDCCDFTQGLIPELALRVARKYFTDVEPLEIDTQRFYAYSMSNYRPEGDAAATREIDLREAEAKEEVDIDLVELETAERDEARKPGSRR